MNSAIQNFRGFVLLSALLLPAAILPASSMAEGIQLPDLDKRQLDNGLRVLLVRQPTVPMVNIEFWVGAGASRDPRGQEGLASLVAEALRKGAGEHDADSISETLDFLGADYRSDVNIDRARHHLDLLSKDLDQGLGLLADMVLRPVFPPTETAKLREQMAEGIAQSKDNPQSVLRDFHRAHLYGDHPYGNPVSGTEGSLPQLTDELLGDYHSRYYGSDLSVLVLVGDLEPDAAFALVEKYFSAMPRSRADLRRMSPPEHHSGTRVRLIDKPDTPQSWFAIGELGPSWQNPDYAPAELVRTVFGGRFTSWLNTKLRIESGLSYGARFSFDRGEMRGPATITSFTAKETTKEALDLTLEQLKRLHRDALSEEELASAKAYLLGSLPWQYETASDLAQALAQLELQGRGPGWIRDLEANIHAVTLEDCRRVIEAEFPGNNLRFTIIAPGDELEGLLRQYGKLERRDIQTAGFRLE